jgi:hypothetical protein
LAIGIVLLALADFWLGALAIVLGALAVIGSAQGRRFVRNFAKPS